MPGSRRAARTSSSVQAIDSGDWRRSDLQHPVAPVAGLEPRPRRVARSGAAKASSIALLAAASAGSGAGRRERRRSRPDRRSRPGAAASSGQRASGTKRSAKPAWIASPGAHAVAGQPEVLAETPRRARPAAGCRRRRGSGRCAHSGMAMRVVSPTTRWLPWPATPTPPPMTKPCISATYGLGDSGRSGVHPVLVGPEARGRRRSRRGGRWRRSRRCRRRRRRRAGPRRR